MLAEAVPAGSAVEVVFAGLDRGVEGEVEQRYERSLSLDEATGAGCVLAYELNGAPLPPQHGFPLRLVVPGWYGMTNVKWLSQITVVEEPFDGYQVANGYRVRQSEDEEGRPVTRMRPRSLMVPPGMPEFMTRERIVDRGEVELEGRAWSGRAPIVRVEVSVDDGGDLGRRRSRARPGPPLGVGRLDVHVGRGGGGLLHALLPRHGRDGGDAAARAAMEPRRVREQRRPARPDHRPLTPARRRTR